MNKQLLIVLLAVCLVSTHAFVKRDAPTATAGLQAQLELVKKQIEEALTNIKDEANKNLNPDAIKQNLNGLVDAAVKVLDSFTPTTEATKPAA